MKGKNEIYIAVLKTIWNIQNFIKNAFHIVGKSSQFFENWLYIKFILSFILRKIFRIDNFCFEKHLWQLGFDSDRKQFLKIFSNFFGSFLPINCGFLTFLRTILNFFYPISEKLYGRHSAPLNLFRMVNKLSQKRTWLKHMEKWKGQHCGYFCNAATSALKNKLLAVCAEMVWGWTQISYPQLDVSGAWPPSPL